MPQVIGLVAGVVLGVLVRYLLELILPKPPDVNGGRPLPLIVGVVVGIAVAAASAVHFSNGEPPRLKVTVADSHGTPVEMVEVGIAAVGDEKDLGAIVGPTRTTDDDGFVPFVLPITLNGELIKLEARKAGYVTVRKSVYLDGESETQIVLEESSDSVIDVVSSLASNRVYYFRMNAGPSSTHPPYLVVPSHYDSSHRKRGMVSLPLVPGDTSLQLRSVDTKNVSVVITAESQEWPLAIELGRSEEVSIEPYRYVVTSLGIDPDHRDWATFEVEVFRETE